MKKLYKIFKASLLVMAWLATQWAQAAPVHGTLVSLGQPDGSAVKVRVWGDEYFRHIESPEGYTLVYDPNTHWLCYANVNSDKSEYVSTGARFQGESTPPAEIALPKSLRLSKEAIAAKVENARSARTSRSNANLRMEAMMAIPTGNIKGLTLLVDFPDVVGTIPRQEIDNLMNQQGYSANGNNGSVRDYFYDVSNGAVTYTNTVAAYYRAPNPRIYYEDASHLRELFVAALNDLKSKGFDFSTLTRDENGMIQGLNMLYAGEWGGQALWPQCNGFSPIDLGNGIKAELYEITGLTAEAKIGTICHENGHLLFGWLDQYDLNGGSDGIGYYCLMGLGNTGPCEKNPTPPNPYYRELAGWTPPISLNASYTKTTHQSVANVTSHKFINEARGNVGGEFFFVENIKRVGRRQNMAGEGLLVWHFDIWRGNNSNNEMTPQSHFQVSIEQADGRFDMEHGVNPGDADDFFRAGHATTFNTTTLPNSNLWNGDYSNFNLTNISAKGDVMSFAFHRYDANSPNMIYQAEEQLNNRAPLQNSGSGFTGYFYVNPDNVANSYVDFQVIVSTAKSYNVKLRYSNSGTTNRSMSVKVNGTTVVATQAFSNTGDWNTWTYLTLPLNLVAGANSIRFTSLNSNGGPNLDKLEIEMEPSTGYSLTTSATAGGNVTLNPAGGVYANGTNVTATAVPLAGFVFSGWSGAASGTSNPVTVLVNSDKSLHATFVPSTTTQYTLATSTTGSGQIQLNPAGGTYPQGSQVTATAVPAAGYTFTGWSGAATGTSNPVTITMNGNKSLVANFTQTTVTYTLSTSTTGSGQVQLNPAGGTYAQGTNVTATAVPAAGYTFSGWSGAATGTSNPVTINMNGNKSLVANFTQTTLTYTLTVNAGTGGTVSTNPTGTTHAAGTSIVLTATPQTGYQFSGWTGAVTSSSNPLTIVLNSNTSVTANFSVVSVSGDICFEAESGAGQASFSPFQVLQNASASGGSYIVVPNGTGNQASPPTTSVVTFSFTASTSSTYYFWVRILANSSNDNSMYIRTDASSFDPWTPGTYTSWTWKKWTSKSLTAGAHTISIASQEDGLQIDKILITKSSSTPSGTGCGSASFGAPIVLAEEEETFATETVTLFPNPAKDILYVQGTAAMDAATITIQSALGEGLSQQEVETVSGDFNLQQHIGHLSPGVYFVKISTADKTIVKQFVKE